MKLEDVLPFLRKGHTITNGETDVKPYQNWLLSNTWDVVRETKEIKRFIIIEKLIEDKSDNYHIPYRLAISSFPLFYTEEEAKGWLNYNMYPSHKYKIVEINFEDFV